MKRIFLLATISLLFSAVAHAQDTPVKNVIQPSQSKTSAKVSRQPDYVMMKDGRLLVYTNNQEANLTEDVVLGNGTVIMRDGTIKMKDGKTIRLNNGESIDKAGVISPTPAANPPLDQTPPNPTPINPATAPAVPPVKATNPVPPNR